MILVVLAIVPAIIAMYVFFFIDFDPDIRSIEKKRTKVGGIFALFALIGTPISWFFYGLNLSFN